MWTKHGICTEAGGQAGGQVGVVEEAGSGEARLARRPEVLVTRVEEDGRASTQGGFSSVDGEDGEGGHGEERGGHGNKKRS